MLFVHFTAIVIFKYLKKSLFSSRSVDALQFSGLKIPGLQMKSVKNMQLIIFSTDSVCFDSSNIMCVSLFFLSYSLIFKSFCLIFLKCFYLFGDPIKIIEEKIFV